jgi:hypothetical protein
MTESEWLQEPKRLRWMHHLVTHGLASDRKLWLLSAGQCRCIWHLLDRWERETVELAERCADGHPGRRELEARFRKVCARRKPKNPYWHYVRPCVLKAAHTERLVRKGDYETWQGLTDQEEVGVKGRASLVGTVNSFIAAAEGCAGGDEVAMQDRVYGVFRDIFGNPFRPVTVDRSWLAGRVRRLARDIYGDRAFERMPTLADALERAGCPRAISL